MDTHEKPAARPPRWQSRPAGSPFRPRYRTGDVVAILANGRDAQHVAAELQRVGIPDETIEHVETARGVDGKPVDTGVSPWVMVIGGPGRDLITRVRSVLRAGRVNRARYFRATVVEELVRVAAPWPPGLWPPTLLVRSAGREPGASHRDIHLVIP